VRRAVRALAVLAATSCLAAAAPAAAPQGCTGFAWPLDTELAWLGASPLESLQSGARLPAFVPKAYSLELRPAASAALPTPPSGKPHNAPAESYAGFVTLPDVPSAGLYQVSLSGPGWIDVIQNGAAAAEQGHTSAEGCPVIRKSLRFQLAAGPAVLELSSVPAAKVSFAIRRAE